MQMASSQFVLLFMLLANVVDGSCVGKLDGEVCVDQGASDTSALLQGTVKLQAIEAGSACPSRCASCVAGSSSDGGVGLYHGECTHYCSKGGACGGTAPYRNGGTDCSGCKGCINLDGGYAWKNSNGDVGFDVYTQTGCSGKNLDNWKYTVKGNVLTLHTATHGVQQGTISGTPGSYTFSFPQLYSTTATQQASGCYWRCPSGCSRTTVCKAAFARDTYGESHMGTKTSSSKCLARKGAFDPWCGITDSIVRFVKAPRCDSFRCPVNLEEVANAASIEGNSASTCCKVPPKITRWGQKLATNIKDVELKVQKLEKSSPLSTKLKTVELKVEQLEGKLSKAPGCYFHCPTGCPVSGSSCKTGYVRDTYGEQNSASGTSSSKCHARLAAFNNWCSKTDMKMQFIEASWISKQLAQKSQKIEGGDCLDKSCEDYKSSGITESQRLYKKATR